MLAFFRDVHRVPDCFPLDVAQLPLKLLAAFDLADELPLEDGHVRIEIDKLVGTGKTGFDYFKFSGGIIVLFAYITSLVITFYYKVLFLQF